MRLVDPATDPWRRAAGPDGEAVVPAAGLLISEAQWAAMRSTWPATGAPGIVLANTTDVTTLAADLPRFALVVLSFPRWTDGRAYSQARLLRARFGYGGEVRAEGDVIVDMLPLLVRTGFDSALLRTGQSVGAASRALGFFADGHYQGDLQEPRPRFARR
jgi:uncharacterized protein (DUF934 family)